MKSNWRTEFYRGLDLRAEREVRGISLAEFARITKFSQRQLSLFESGQYHELPGDLFIRSMVRIYVEKLGLDPDMVQLEIMHKTREERAGKKESETVKDDAGNRFFRSNFGPVAGFFIGTGLVMVLLWPAKDLDSLQMRMPSHSGTGETRIEWYEADKNLEQWFEGNVMLRGNMELSDNIETYEIGREGILIESSVPAWVHVQDMVTGAEQLKGIFPGESFECEVEDETVVIFEKPEHVTLIDQSSDKTIQRGVSEIVRFIPVNIHTIMQKREQG